MTAFESDFHLIWFLLERGRWKPPPGRGDTLGASFPLLSDVLPPPSIHHVRYHFPSWVMELCAVQLNQIKMCENQESSVLGDFIYRMRNKTQKEKEGLF